MKHRAILTAAFIIKSWQFANTHTHKPIHIAVHRHTYLGLRGFLNKHEWNDYVVVDIQWLISNGRWVIRFLSVIGILRSFWISIHYKIQLHRFHKIKIERIVMLNSASFLIFRIFNFIYFYILTFFIFYLWIKTNQMPLNKRQRKVDISWDIRFDIVNKIWRKNTDKCMINYKNCSEDCI